VKLAYSFLLGAISRFPLQSFFGKKPQKGFPLQSGLGVPFQNNILVIIGFDRKSNIVNHNSK